MNYMEELRSRLKQGDSPIKVPPPPPRGLVRPPKRNINFSKFKEQPRENPYPFVEEMNGTQNEIAIPRQ